MRVLLVEDDADLSRQLKAALGDAGYAVDHAPDGEEAHYLGENEPYDVIVLDLGLPKIDGVSVLERWRREGKTTPVLILTARGAWSDKVAGFDAGADDYLTKPFGVQELLARLRVALRHRAAVAGEAEEPVYTLGEIRVDRAKRQVFVGDEEKHLTPTEYRLLTTLVKYAGKVVTHRQLLKEAWGPPYAGETQYLRVYMGQLRHKLEADPARPRYLVTEPGVGYRLRDD